MDTSDPAAPQRSGDVIRSHLAAERTLLAWWRSGLAALAVALAVGRLLPALIRGSRTPFVVLGVGFGLLSLAFVIYGTRRQAHVQRAIDGGAFEPPDRRIVLLMGAAMVLMALATIVIVLTFR